tara:strand:+ start:458 stop:610 length:153 start_codon:yes stop_codon:yes gene_type:complete
MLKEKACKGSFPFVSKPLLNSQLGMHQPREVMLEGSKELKFSGLFFYKWS